MLIILEEGSPAVVTRIRRCGIDALEMCHAWLVRRFVRLIASLIWLLMPDLVSQSNGEYYFFSRFQF